MLPIDFPDGAIANRILGSVKIHVRISVTDTGLWSTLEMERKLKEYLY